LTLRPGRPLVFAATLWAGLASAALADVTKVFEWREASGAVSFSQEAPPPGTKGVTVREVDSGTFTPAQKLAIRAQLARLDAAQRADATRFREQLTASDRAVNQALRRLTHAEQAVSDGRTPASGERVGNANGNSRLRNAYFDRQKQLEIRVQEARADVELAYRVRAELMP